VGSSSDNVLTNGTIEGWIKTSNAGGGYSGIIVKQASYSLFLYNNELITYDWSGVGNISTGRFLNDNAWHHVAMSFQSGVNAGTVIYLDGEAVLTTRYTVPSNGVALALGAGNDGGGQNFAGSIDEVRIWNVVRTASEIAGNRNVSVESNSPGLVSYFKLDETSGTTAFNAVSGGVNGTLVNNPTWNTTSGGINGTTLAPSITPNLSLSDVDDSVIATGATVSINSGLTAGDALSIPAARLLGGVTANYSNGVLTFTGSTTVANYQSMLRAVAFTSSSDDPTVNSATRTINYSVTDSNTSAAFN
jgi:hypothetical protein